MIGTGVVRHLVDAEERLHNVLLRGAWVDGTHAEDGAAVESRGRAKGEAVSEHGLDQAGVHSVIAALVAEADDRHLRRAPYFPIGRSTKSLLGEVRQAETSGD